MDPSWEKGLEHPPRTAKQRNALSRRKRAVSIAAFAQAPFRLAGDMRLPAGQLGTSPGQPWALPPLCSPTPSRLPHKTSRMLRKGQTQLQDRSSLRPRAGAAGARSYGHSQPLVSPRQEQQVPGQQPAPPWQPHGRPTLQEGPQPQWTPGGRGLRDAVQIRPQTSPSWSPPPRTAGWRGARGPSSCGAQVVCEPHVSRLEDAVRLHAPRHRVAPEGST